MNMQAVYETYLQMRARGWTREMIAIVLGKPYEKSRYRKDLIAAAERDPGIAETLRQNKLIAQSTILRVRGWTKKQLESIGDADEYVRNPHYSTASEMKLYRVGRIEDAERNQGFGKRKT
ncbi:MAG: hypothetical protein ACYC8W_07710 [Candidatus Tyrphobacter sp.]